MGEAVVPPAEAGGNERTWFGPGVAGIGTASLLADVGREVPAALLPSLVTSILRAPAAALGMSLMYRLLVDVLHLTGPEALIGRCRGRLGVAPPGSYDS